VLASLMRAASLRESSRLQGPESNRHASAHEAELDSQSSLRLASPPGVEPGQPASKTGACVRQDEEVEPPLRVELSPPAYGADAPPWSYGGLCSQPRTRTTPLGQQPSVLPLHQAGNRGRPWEDRPHLSRLSCQRAGACAPSAAPGDGIEPPYAGPEPAALPLGYPGMFCSRGSGENRTLTDGSRGHCSTFELLTRGGSPRSRTEIARPKRAVL
jgi:hypothetical protein